MNSPIERLTKKEERSGFLMATLDEDELYAVQNFMFFALWLDSGRNR